MQGLLFISLTTRLPRFQDRWDLSELFVSGLLLMVVLLAGAGSALAEVAATRGAVPRRCGSGSSCRPSGLPLVAGAPQRGVFVGGLAVYGLGLGVVDAASNMQAVAVEHRYGRTILPSFHGAWTAGGIVATVVTIAVTKVGLLAGPAARCASSRWCSSSPRSCPRAPTRRSRRRCARPGRPVAQDLLLGAAMVLFYMVDTAATTWGPVFLKSVHEAPDWLLPLATLPYLVASLATRLAGDPRSSGSGPVPPAADRRGRRVRGTGRHRVLPVVVGGRPRLHGRWVGRWP